MGTVIKAWNTGGHPGEVKSSKLSTDLYLISNARIFLENLLPSEIPLDQFFSEE